jgi:transposase
MLRLYIMKNSEAVKKLKAYLKKLKKQQITTSILRTIIRIKALIAYYKGSSIKNVATCYDISDRSLKSWIEEFETRGLEGLNDKVRSGRPSKLPKENLEELKKVIEEQNQRIWVARHVYLLIVTTFGVIYSVKYIPELLGKIGLSYHKAIHNLIKKDNEKRKEYIQEKLPEIYRKKIEEGWRIFYQDEVGFQTEGTLGYTWGAKGKKTEIKNYGRHGRMNLVGAFELGTGIFYGILTSFKVNAMRFRRFICHLKREMRTDKIILICDNASFHKAKWLSQWVETQKAWLKLEFLPAYSPDFNPIERLWRWMKTEFTHNKCWRTKEDLKKYLIGILEQMPLHADSLKSLMKKENERFEKICEYYDVQFIEQFNALG